MEYKHLAEDSKETDSIYSQDSTIIRNPNEAHPPPSYKRIPTLKTQRETRWRRFLATKITVRHVILGLMIYWAAVYLNNCSGLTNYLGNVVRTICYYASKKIGELIAPEDPIHTFSKWNTREHGGAYRDDDFPGLHSRLRFNGRDV